MCEGGGSLENRGNFCIFLRHQTCHYNPKMNKKESVHSVTHCRRAVCSQSHVTTSHAFYFYKFLLCVFNSIFDISFPKIHVCLYFPMCQSCEHILRVQSTAVTGKKFSHTEIKNRILCFLCLDFILFLERKRKRIEA